MKGQIEKRGDGAYRLRWYTGRVNGNMREQWMAKGRPASGLVFAQKDDG